MKKLNMILIEGTVTDIEMRGDPKTNQVVLHIEIKQQNELLNNEELFIVEASGFLIDKFNKECCFGQNVRVMGKLSGNKNDNHYESLIIAENIEGKS